MPSGEYVESFENLINELDEPVALGACGVSDTIASNPISGADQQFACNCTLFELYGKVKGLAAGMSGLNMRKQIGFDGNPEDLSKIRRSEALFQV